MRRLRWAVLSCALAGIAPLSQGCGTDGAAEDPAGAGEAGFSNAQGGTSGNGGAGGKGGSAGNAGSPARGGASGQGGASGSGTAASAGDGAGGDGHAGTGAGEAAIGGAGSGARPNDAGAAGDATGGGASGRDSGDAGHAGDSGASGATNDGEAGAGGAGGASIEGERCDNALDDDGDDLVDCADDDCSVSSACGASPLGARCENDADCAGGVCIVEDPYGFPGGYCSTPCLPEVGACGAGGGLCVTFPVGAHAAVCWKACTLGDDTCDPLYSCQGVSAASQYACGPECTAHADCPVLGNCNFDRGFCDALIENCANGQDDDGEGYVDCSDLNCCGNPSCSENPNPRCP